MEKCNAWLNGLAVWILIGGLCCATQGLAYTATVNGVTWTYTVTNGTATIENPRQYFVNNPAIPTSTTGAITIPSSLGGYPVTSIGEYACNSCTGLTSVTIPASVTNIQQYAFYKCSSLKTVHFGRGVKEIGWAAFAECRALVSLAFPGNATLTSIGGSAFDSCSGLTSVKIPGTVKIVGFQAFMYSGLKSITIPDSVTDIGANAFRSCGLTNAVIGQSVTNIGFLAFRGSGLRNITFPASVQYIGNDAFCGSGSLSNVWFEGGPPAGPPSPYSMFDGEGPALRGMATNAQGYYKNEYAAEWEKVIGTDGKYQGLLMKREGNKYAVCVGINEYKEVQPSLSGCVNDSIFMEKNLVERGGWTLENITRLNDAQATKKAIRSAIANVAAKAMPGDTFVYQHASHGDQYDRKSGQDQILTENGKKVFLCVYDEKNSDNDTAYNDFELADDLSAFRAGVKVVVIVDACHSGGLFKNAARRDLSSDSFAFNLPERVTVLMDASRTRRISRGEKGAEAHLSSSEIGWVTAVEYYELSREDSYYHPDSRTDFGGDFSCAFTMGWWNGQADASGVGDGDGYMDGYEGWKYAHAYLTNKYKYPIPDGQTPQYYNADVLRSVELGVSGEWTVPVPTAPTVKISSREESANEDAIVVEWTGGGRASGFNLYRSTSDSRPKSPCKTGVRSPYVDDDPSLKPGVKYYYWVEAVNSSGSAFSESDWGNRAVSLDVTPTAVPAGAMGGQPTFVVMANTSWKAKRSGSWITLTTAAGNGTGYETCGFTVAANNSAKARTGTITVTAGGGTAYPKSVTISVTQAKGPANVTETVGEGTWSYAANGGTATIVGGATSSMTTIPETLGGVPVTAIAAAAFAFQDLRSLSIPDGVTVVGDNAFFQSGLETLIVPREWEGTGLLANAGVPEGCTVIYRSAPQTVWRFYSKKYKGHFFTISEEEKENLNATNPNWNFEGGAYRAYTNAAAGTVALHRFYSKNYRGHFFTIDEEEMEAVRATNPNWKYEGVAYYVYPNEVAGTVPVYRFWSKAYKHHFYTTSEEEKDNLMATNPNWKYETVAFWALPLEEKAGEKVAKVAAASGAERREGQKRLEEAAEGGGGGTTRSARAGGGVVVTTSDGSDGSAVADGDEGTGWSPEGAGDAWVVLSYAEPVEVESVTVAGENLPEGLRALWSEDAESWEEEAPMAARYVWVALPGGEAAPVVREISVAP